MVRQRGNGVLVCCENFNLNDIHDYDVTTVGREHCSSSIDTIDYVTGSSHGQYICAGHPCRLDLQENHKNAPKNDQLELSRAHTPCTPDQQCSQDAVSRTTFTYLPEL